MPGYGMDPEITAFLTRPLGYSRGYPTFTQIAQPAAGAAAVVSVPGDRFYRLITARFSLATSAAVATRTPQLLWQTADSVEWARFPASGGIGASSSVVAQWAVATGSTYTGNDGSLLVSIPDVIIRPGDRIVLSAANIQAADQLSGVETYWEEFPNGPTGYPSGVQSVASGPTV
jgi:hypothetical protein